MFYDVLWCSIVFYYVLRSFFSGLLELIFIGLSFVLFLVWIKVLVILWQTVKVRGESRQIKVAPLQQKLTEMSNNHRLTKVHRGEEFNINPSATGANRGLHDCSTKGYWDISQKSKNKNWQTLLFSHKKSVLIMEM